MAFTFNSCPISGLLEIKPYIHGDKRGYFFESYSERDFKAAGLSHTFIQDNQSSSSKGVLRGLHYQKKHPQTKLVRVIEGEVFDVALDMRQDSSTKGKWFGITLSGKKNNQFFIPSGFAHGFLVLSETAILSYKCTDFYYPEDEAGILWNDPSIGIKWPDIDTAYILSDKDRNWPSWESVDLANRQ